MSTFYPVSPSLPGPAYPPPPPTPFIQRTVRVAALFGEEVEWVTLNLLNYGTVRWFSSEVNE